MTTTEMEKPTLGERYCAATESSNLKLGERMGDVDLVIAAGLVGDGPATALYRLQVEYDAVRAEHRAAEANLRSREAAAGRAETASEKQTILDDAERAARTEHVLILTQLTSLREAKRLFGDYAIQEATRRRFMRPDGEVLILAGQVLDVFLNPTCRHCEGRGFNGASHRGEAQILCRPCRGSGHRRDAIGKTDEQRNFAAHLILSTDALMYQVQRDIRTNLNALREAKQRIADQTAA